jgi:hypothetical protein
VHLFIGGGLRAKWLKGGAGRSDWACD